MPRSDDSESDTPSPTSEDEFDVKDKGKGKEATGIEDDPYDDAKRVIVQAGFDAYFSVTASRAVTSKNIFSSLIQPLSAEEYAEAISADSIGEKKLESRILHEPARSALHTQIMCELQEGFNVVCYGFGSKRKWLNEFATTRCAKKGHVVVVNGFHPEVTLRDLLGSIEDIKGVSSLPLTANTPDGQARRIYDFFSDKDTRGDLYLIIHNIDFLLTRAPKAKPCLSLLALHPRIHLVASVDHINAPLLFTATESATRKDGVAAPGKTPRRGFAWLWHDCTTLAGYDFELTFADHTSVTGASGRRHADAAIGSGQAPGAVISETAALHVLAAVNDRAKKLFILMARRQLESIDAGDPSVDMLRETAVAYDVLFPLARQEFLGQTDTAVRALLGEFLDHGLVLSAQASSGGEVLWIPVRKERLVGILKTLGA